MENWWEYYLTGNLTKKDLHSEDQKKSTEKSSENILRSKFWKSVTTQFRKGAEMKFL